MAVEMWRATRELERLVGGGVDRDGAGEGDEDEMEEGEDVDGDRDAEGDVVMADVETWDDATMSLVERPEGRRKRGRESERVGWECRVVESYA